MSNTLAYFDKKVFKLRSLKIWANIQKTLFSSQLKNETNKLVCYTTKACH
jgi:hypothetical protein